jgi:integrase
VATGRATINPALALRGTLTKVRRDSKQPAIVDLAVCRALYRAISNGPGELEVICCAMLQALTAVRPSDARCARWDEVEGLDGPAPVWTIPAARLKGTQDQKADKARRHVVPLSGAAVAVLQRVRQISGHRGLIFPSPRFPDRPMTDMTLSMMYRRAGYDGRHVPHGWRASFSTIMNERHPAERDAIDAALAHVRGGTEGRYNRAEHLARRRELMAEWAAILEDEA